MKSYNDEKLAALVNQTGILSGSVNDLESAFLILKGADATKSLNDKWMEVFRLNGATAGAWNDAAQEFLGGEGAPYQSLEENWKWYWLSMLPP